MRNRVMISTAALVLASASFAWAQQKPQPQQHQQDGRTISRGTTGGVIDIGGRYTSATGDEARFERYRDLRNGSNVNLLYTKVVTNGIFNASAENIGYRDQRYTAGFTNRRVKFSVFYDQTPLNYSYMTRTPYTCTAGDCSLDPALQAQVQAKTAVGIPRSTAELSNGSLSIYDAVARQFDLRSRRDTIAGNAVISATDNLDVTFAFNSYQRTGNMPWGGSFAFPIGIEMPLVIDNRTTNASAGVEWASHQGMFRVAYDYSKFNQNIPTFTWDNPVMATDYNQNRTTVTGYDPSGYSNGNGPATGRMAMAPTNTLATFNWLGMVKLPNRTTANGSFSMGAGHQNEALIPWTINPVIANPALNAAFPGLAALPRDTAQMSVNYTTGTFNLNSRPNRYVTLSARYRFNSRSDFAPHFAGEEYVRFDAVPEETGGESEQFQINRNTFDANVSFTPMTYGAIRVGYTVDKWQHTVRATGGWRDNTARVSFDTAGNQYVTLRAQFERTDRAATDLSIARLEDMAMQPAARFYDEAARSRNRATLIAELNPASIVGVNVTVSRARDDYKEGDPAQQFGLLDNDNTAYTIGFNVAPSARANFGIDYGRQTFSSLQEVRNANPAPDRSWTDPNRNWRLDNDETVNNVAVYTNLVGAIPKTDVRIGYDYSDSDQAFVHSGPRIDAFVTG
ncbi:MAG: MtrB/PioB family outer membrane beta-barrel protein, partial [Acidobacteria bacterium]|nr:MtrB/PioB family outer membrane beta-barrel protein [Acidobacteriota bacterium]